MKQRSVKITAFLLMVFAFIGNTGAQSHRVSEKKARKILAGISSRHEADSVRMANPLLGISVLQPPAVDSSGAYPQLRSSAVGSVLFQNGYAYKLIERSEQPAWRASFIYLTTTKMEQLQIEGIRKLIIDELNKGVSFETVAARYSMDESRTMPDLGWFGEGAMLPQFEQAVKTHAVGEIFKVDIPENFAYYVAKKTGERMETNITVVSIAVK